MNNFESQNLHSSELCSSSEVNDGGCNYDWAHYLAKLYGEPRPPDNDQTSEFDCQAALDALQADLAACDQLLPGTEIGEDFSLDPLPNLSDSSTHSNGGGASRRGKISKTYRLAQKILGAHSILTDRKFLWVYDSATGAYTKADDPVATVHELLTAEERMTCEPRQIEAIAEWILKTPAIYHKGDDFNSNPSLINLKNGVLDLDSMSMLPHSPDLLFTYAIDAHYLAGQPPDSLECPTFENFCKTSLDSDPRKRQLLLEICGFCLSDIEPVKAKCAFFFKGEPDSGKSVLCEWITRLLDDDLVSHISLHEIGSRFKRIELRGRKMNICSEIKGSSIPDITIFKQVTGGDRTDGEYKRGATVSFKPHCKLVFAGNTLPSSKESDKTRAFANRMVVLLFTKSIPEDKQNPSLLDDLVEERDQIFTLAMYALADLRRRKFQFQLPQESSAFVQLYIERANSIQSFIDNRCLLAPEARIHNVPLYAAYVEYCNEILANPIKKGEFSEYLDNLPNICRKKFRLNEKNTWGRTGIALKP